MPHVQYPRPNWCQFTYRLWCHHYVCNMSSQALCRHIHTLMDVQNLCVALAMSIIERLISQTEFQCIITVHTHGSAVTAHTIQ